MIFLLMTFKKYIKSVARSVADWVRMVGTVGTVHGYGGYGRWVRWIRYMGTVVQYMNTVHAQPNMYPTPVPAPNTCTQQP